MGGKSSIHHRITIMRRRNCCSNSIQNLHSIHVLCSLVHRNEQQLCPIYQVKANGMQNLLDHLQQLQAFAANSRFLSLDKRKKNIVIITTHPKTSMAARICVMAVATQVMAMPKPRPEMELSKKYHSPKLRNASVSDR